jgi:hypothetical protein
MYQDFLDEIIAFYRIKQKDATLAQRLIRPTPGSIRDECLSVCESRLDAKDHRTLSAFFNAEIDQKTLHRAILRFEIDRFRPLCNFLLGKSTTTDDLNIELLGWLIDYPKRPYRAENHPDPSSVTGNVSIFPDSLIAPPTEIDSETLACKNDKDGLYNAPSPASTQAQKKTIRNKVILAAMGLLALAIVSFFLVDNKSNWREKKGKSVDSGISAIGYQESIDSNAAKSATSGLEFARCVGASPCKACSNCSSCNWCNSGGNCGICAGSKKPSNQKRKLQCQAITKKGKQCSRTAKPGSNYCFQHINNHTSAFNQKSS